MVEVESLRQLLEGVPEKVLEGLPSAHPFKAGDELLDRSLAIISKNGGGTWLAKLRKRLLDVKSSVNVASALTEIRVYRELFDAALTVTPLDRADGVVSPDFEVDAGDGAFIVEVFAKQMQSQEAPPVEVAEYKGKNAHIRMELHEIFPAGAPDPNKRNDTSLANMISKVCGAKGKEHQVSKTKPTILWIDFREFGSWPESLDVEEASPLTHWREGLTSGALWYAFYGWKGAPIFQEDFFPRDVVVPMGHDGRFEMSGDRQSKLSAVILRLSAATVVFENPRAIHPLPVLGRRHLLNLPKFDLSRSIMEWAPGMSARAVEQGREKIEALAKLRDRMCHGDDRAVGA